MVFRKYRIIDQIPHILFVSLGEKEHSLRIPFRGTSKPFTLWIFTNAFENGFDCPFQFLQPLQPLFRRGFQAFPRSKTYSEPSAAASKGRPNLDSHGQLSPSKSIGGFKV